MDHFALKMALAPARLSRFVIASLPQLSLPTTFVGSIHALDLE